VTVLLSAFLIQEKVKAMGAEELEADARHIRTRLLKSGKDEDSLPVRQILRGTLSLIEEELDQRVLNACFEVA
jgi:hypothetical protein